VAIAREDLSFTAEDLQLLLPRSKGDQEGQGASLGIARGSSPETCPGGRRAADGRPGRAAAGLLGAARVAGA
jgi:hypothetical protein